MCDLFDWLEMLCVTCLLNSSHFPREINSAVLLSLCQVVWSASICQLLSLHKRQQRVSPFRVSLKGMYISFVRLEWRSREPKKR